MIYTVTCNPAMDYTVQMPVLYAGALNRVGKAALYPGGKGINVSRVLRLLGTPNEAWGFAAGGVGNLLADALCEEGLDADLIRLSAGSTRINVKICAAPETELNAPGPAVDEAAWRTLTDRISYLRAGDILCLCGSVPAVPGADAYRRLTAAMAGTGVRVVVDADGALLVNALEAHPWLIKPNRAELEELVGRPLPDDAAIADAAEEWRRRGVENLLISLGGDGAMLCCAAGVFRCPAPAGTVAGGTVGAGDATLAGFLSAVAAGDPPEEALRLAVSCGSAAAYCESRLTDRAPIDALRESVRATRLR